MRRKKNQKNIAKSPPEARSVHEALRGSKERVHVIKDEKYGRKLKINEIR